MDLLTILTKNEPKSSRKDDIIYWLYRLALIKFDGNITKASAWAGVSIRTLRNFVSENVELKDLIEQARVLDRRAKEKAVEVSNFIRRNKHIILHKYVEKHSNASTSLYEQKMCSVKKGREWRQAGESGRKAIESNYKKLFGLGDASCEQ